ncbi:unnamed protein product [Citrullus colocynthis]|uniref:Uncharacterized protein n=1 Tax=Citrullus colocynthis TaxID=252529 RepID=A0ABP0Y6J2_9ROSI
MDEEIRRLAWHRRLRVSVGLEGPCGDVHNLVRSRVSRLGSCSSAKILVKSRSLSRTAVRSCSSAEIFHQISSVVVKSRSFDAIFVRSRPSSDLIRSSAAAKSLASAVQPPLGSLLIEATALLRFEIIRRKSSLRFCFGKVEDSAVSIKFLSSFSLGLRDFTEEFLRFVDFFILR